MTAPMTRWLVAGAGGMLGQDLAAVLASRDAEVTLARRADLDVTDAQACHDAVRRHDVVVNAAAWTAVDDAETHEAEAFAVNAVGAANLARAVATHGARLVHVSTDYVFAGDAVTPYTEDAPLAPRSAYGRTKAAGEWAVRAYCPQSWTVRTAWLYGAGGPNFVKTMLHLAAQRDTLSVVADQAGQPTWSADLAQAIVRLVETAAPFGTYHGTSSGAATWFELAQQVFREAGLDPSRISPTTTEAFPRPAPRPTYSVLGHDGWDNAGLEPIRDWREALAEALPSLHGNA